MDVVRALVGVHRFQVRQVPHGLILGEDAVGAEQPPRLAGYFGRHSDIVPLGERDLLRGHRALSPADFGSNASLGTRTSWSTISLVSLARRLNFPVWSLAENPFVSVGTRKPRMDPGSSSGPVLAHTTATCAVDPFVIHIFAPFSTHPSFVSF